MEETIRMVPNDEVTSPGLVKQETKIKMVNNNPQNDDDDDEFWNPVQQENNQFDDFDSDGEELMQAASKIDGFNFDDSDEEEKK